MDQAFLEKAAETLCIKSSVFQKFFSVHIIDKTDQHSSSLMGVQDIGIGYCIKMVKPGQDKPTPVFCFASVKYVFNPSHGFRETNKKSYFKRWIYPDHDKIEQIEKAKKYLFLQKVKTGNECGSR
ncbi:MAG: hypothetical protein R2875_17160 [Desulfobacterales bacterium]